MWRHPTPFVPSKKQQQKQQTKHHTAGTKMAEGKEGTAAQPPSAAREHTTKEEAEENDTNTTQHTASENTKATERHNETRTHRQSKHTSQRAHALKTSCTHPIRTAHGEPFNDKRKLAFGTMKRTHAHHRGTVDGRQQKKPADFVAIKPLRICGSNSRARIAEYAARD